MVFLSQAQSAVDTAVSTDKFDSVRRRGLESSPAHRELKPSPSCLRGVKRRRLSEEPQVRFPESECTSKTSIVAVTAKDIKFELYEPDPEFAVECDWCCERGFRSRGRLRGVPGAPMSVQYMFQCRFCEDEEREKEEERQRQQEKEESMYTEWLKQFAKLIKGREHLLGNERKRGHVASAALRILDEDI